MARTIEQSLAEVRAARIDDPKTLEQFRKALQSTRSGCGLVVEAIARRVMEGSLAALAPDLAAAFASLLEDPVKRDPQCRGKIAVARALAELEHWDDRVFVAGLRVVQMEGWGHQLDDTAVELRGLCGLAYARFFRPDALDVLVTLLVDKEPGPREAGARGIGDLGRPDATAVLRYLILVGERQDAAVLSSACESLLSLAREASTTFLLGLLDEHDERSDAAALALGSARITGAHDALVEFAQQCMPERRHRVGYLALALLRSDAARAHLLDIVRTRAKGDAVAAARALATFKNDPAVASELAAVARELTDTPTRVAIEAMLD